MASEAESCLQATSQPSSSSQHHRRRLSGDSEKSHHQCFVCLSNEGETPQSEWVDPCPCSLEAHQECLLHWLDEMQQRTPAGDDFAPQCYACRGRIYVREPTDSLIELAKHLHRIYSRASIMIVGASVVSGSFVTTASYGILAARIFAGPVIFRWLGLADLPNGSWHHNVRPFAVVGFKSWLLSLVGPALTIYRVVPAVGRLLVVPLSFAYGAMLAASEDLPTWPPSPSWAFVMLSSFQMTYCALYDELFGPLERKLKGARRDLPDTARPPPAGPAHEEHRDQRQQLAQPQDNEEGQPQGALSFWRQCFRIAGLAFEILTEAHTTILVEGEAAFDEEDEIRLDVIREDVPLDEARQPQAEPGAPRGEGLVDSSETSGTESRREPRGNVGDGSSRYHDQNDDDDDNDNDDYEDDDADFTLGDSAFNVRPATPLEPVPVPVEPAELGADAPRYGPSRTLTVNDIFNNIVTSLLLPGISFGIGEAIRLTLPIAWVKRPLGRPPTGLLQQRWGRSLVGGCLFIVLSDFISLYHKYRRVQLWKKRKVVNYDKKNQRYCLD